jgi:pimeloyl-ACP methyl ester carboxylesterase
VTAPDLRGYGDSARPPAGAGHAGYAKRTMAAELVAEMRDLGFERFAVVGHDRGARVAYRMALDHPQAVAKLTALDIVPTLTMWDRMDHNLATGSCHGLFLIQPNEPPERMIGRDRWGEQEIARRANDPLAVRRQSADDLRGQPIACGHFLAEEAPDATAAALEAFR